MNFWVIIGFLILGIVIIAGVFIGFIILVIYAVASGIAYKNETEASAWEYWEMMKTKRWIELSEEEKKK